MSQVKVSQRAGQATTRPLRATPRLHPMLAGLLVTLAALWERVRPVSAFEKAIAINSAVIVLETGAGYWITQHNPEAYHYLIDTAFIALAAFTGVVINFLLLRASFAPLTRALEVVQAVQRGALDTRVPTSPTDPDAQTLAVAFNGMLDELEEARDEAARQVLRAHEAERRQVALELHDQIGQSLTAVALHAEALSQRLSAPTGDHKAAAQAERLAMLAQRAISEVQALSRQLRPPLLDDAGLAAALRALADDTRERLAIATHLDLRGYTDDARLPGEIETALFRIAQESLTNAVRHGKATHARIRLRRGERSLSLLIVDSGRGFDPASPTLRCGLGLVGMRERAHLAGGVLRLRSRPGAGCVVLARIPAPPAASLATELSAEHISIASREPWPPMAESSPSLETPR